ncbi:NAD(P)H-quinone oxidoreductase [Alphaproteobacteria bacterium]|nr:NAD(P)H-quinone oxidoreductase [Alphaproteobacteria bacterium]
MNEILPTTMQAISIGQDKTPESLTCASVAVPSFSDEEVLVRIAAAGVNRGDCFQRMGFYPAPPGASEIMGLEFSGTIVACGAKVSKWQIGDRVAALVAGGGYAEYGVVHQDHILPVPEDMSFVDAAALPETIYTVWANVFELGGLKRGDNFLVHGGSSGIGTTAIQMAKHAGARVMATAGSADKCAACTDLGADLAVNYNLDNFVEASVGFSDGLGMNVILDMVGGAYFQRNIQAAARGGRIINIAHLQGSRAEIDMMPVMLKNLTLTGSTLRARALEEKTRLTQAVAAHIWPHIRTHVKPIIDSTFPLAQAGKAHQLMESSAHIGKIILQCEGDEI